MQRTWWPEAVSIIVTKPYSSTSPNISVQLGTENAYWTLSCWFIVMIWVLVCNNMYRHEHNVGSFYSNPTILESERQNIIDRTHTWTQCSVTISKVIFATKYDISTSDILHRYVINGIDNDTNPHPHPPHPTPTLPPPPPPPPPPTPTTPRFVLVIGPTCTKLVRMWNRVGIPGARQVFTALFSVDANEARLSQCWKSTKRLMGAGFLLFQRLPNVGIQNFGMWGVYDMAKTDSSL